MSADACPYELAVTEAARSAEWSENLRTHLDECRECAKSAGVIEWLGAVATQLGRSQPAPDPSYIWLKAEIERHAAEVVPVSQHRFRALSLVGLMLGVAGSSAVLAVLPAVSAAADAARASLLTTLAEASVVDLTAIATAWLGLPLLLTATYLLVLRPSR